MIRPPLHLLLLLPQRDAEFRSRPNARPLPDEDEGNRAHDGAQAADEGTRARYPELLKHACRRQGQHHGQDGPTARRSRVGRRRKHFVRVRQIVQQGHEDEQIAHAERDSRQHGHSKGDRRPGAEAQPEKGCNEERASEDRERQTTKLLTLGPWRAALLGPRQHLVPVPEYAEAESAPRPDGKVCQTRVTGAEAVQVPEYDGECLEGHVEDGIHEGQVGTRGRDNELRGQHANRPRDDDGEQLSDARFFKLARRNDAQGGLLLAHLLCAAGKQDWAKSLGQPDDDAERDSGVDEADPECPSPADGGRCVP